MINLSKKLMKHSRDRMRMNVKPQLSKLKFNTVRNRMRTGVSNLLWKAKWLQMRFSHLSSSTMKPGLAKFGSSSVRWLQSYNPTHQFSRIIRQGSLNTRMYRGFSWRNLNKGGKNWTNRISNYLYSLPRPLYSYILGINSAIFLMYQVPVFDSMFLNRNIALSPDALGRGKFWTMLTYGFAHQGFLHFAFNMLTLFFIGRTAEMLYGPFRLLQLYLGGTFFGGLLQLQRAHSPFTIIQGASCGLGAILAFWVIRNPFQTIFLYFIPLPAWLFGTLFMGYSFLMMNSQSTIGHAGHFGGGLFGAFTHLALKKGWFKR